MIVEAPKPVVAALEGSAAGGGAGLALACDHIVMGESAGLVIPFLKIGLVPDYGIAYTTSRRAGPAVCRRLLLRPSRVAAAEAEIMGLADEVRPDGQVQEAAVAAALSLARQPRTAFAWSKRLLSAAMPPIEQVFALEKQAQAACFDSAEFKAAMQRRSAK
jgi:2-(1,2-epoxy-1,2-dihydrophenyl)acetyl-CoA isomerase